MNILTAGYDKEKEAELDYIASLHKVEKGAFVGYGSYSALSLSTATTCMSKKPLTWFDRQVHHRDPFKARYYVRLRLTLSSR